MTAHKRSKSKKNRVNPEYVRQRLKLAHLEAKQKFSEKHGEAEKILRDRGVGLSGLRQHSAKVIGASALAGALILSPGDSTQGVSGPHGALDDLRRGRESIPAQTPRTGLVQALREILPKETRPLSREEEKYLESVIEETIGVPAKATLEGEHLNTTYGKIGAEQHLRRFPGDTNDQHAPTRKEYGGDRPEEILKEGIAPGLGAWGYFAPSKGELTDDLKEIEQWYAVVQTLYLPDWNTRQPYLKNWYQYRKVLIINTDNGKAVVASIADSGPAAFTGKHFGGSPEVMDYLGGPRYKKGNVLLFFVDDPNNKVKLGPVEYNRVAIPGAGVANLGI